MTVSEWYIKIILRLGGIGARIMLEVQQSNESVSCQRRTRKERRHTWDYQTFLCSEPWLIND
jgi:hypothetical protein